MGIASDKIWYSITFKFIESTLSLLCVTIKENIYRGDTCPADKRGWGQNLTTLPQQPFLTCQWSGVWKPSWYEFCWTKIYFVYCSHGTVL